MQLLGIDHVTAITASREECLDFYAGVLDLDLTGCPLPDSSGGDLCFGDGREGPAVLRFVNSPEAATGAPGPGMVHSIRWWVPGRRALEQWAARFELFGVPTRMTFDSSGDPLAMHFSDPEGLAHELMPQPAAERSRRFEPTPGPPSALKLGGVRAFVAGSVQSFDLLAGRLGFSAAGEGEWRIGPPPAPALYACDAPPPNRPFQGAGTVHHVAWRCAPGEERAWRQRVIGMGATVSRLSEEQGIRWFFFREPDGVLFSVASVARTLSASPPTSLPARPRELPARIARPVGLRAAA
ncbi:MAG TPA: VOC family protein [Solirubrobacterales bacterium]|jgi:glyoxalase family protein|nr:VOC family protein [Solirubrobacterales bacterium]